MRKIDTRVVSASFLFVTVVFAGYSVLHAQSNPPAQASKSPKLAE